MSAWIWRSRSFAAAPPSTRSSESATPESRLDGLDDVPRLEGDRLERRARDVRSVGAACEAEDRAARVGVPVRRAQADERGDDVDAVGVGDAVRELLGFGSGGDEAQLVAQPLHGRAGDEDGALEGVGDLVATVMRDAPGDCGQQDSEVTRRSPMFMSRKAPVP